MEVKVRDIKDVSVVDIDGAIDLNSSELVEVASWLLKNNRQKILFNLEKVDFVDYSGLSILAMVHKNVGNKKGILKLCHVALHIVALFRAANMLEIFDVLPDEPEALKSFEVAISPKDRSYASRRFQRLDIKITLHYRLISRSRPRADILSAKVVNISGAGVFVYTHDVFPIESRLELEILLPTEKEAIKAEGMVIWLADKNLQPDSYPGMGIQFTLISPEDNKRILDFIEKNAIHRASS